MSGVLTTRVDGRVEATNSRGSAVPPIPFEQDATVVLGKFQDAVAALLAAAPGDRDRIADVKKSFGVDHRLAWQIHKIANASMPFTAGMYVPARVSMQKLLRAAERRGVPSAITLSVEAAFEDFERLQRTHADDRAELEAMLSGLVPEAREKQEMNARRDAFRLMSQIKGVAIEANVCAFFLHPSADGQRVDRVLIDGQLGLRRLRTGAPAGFFSNSIGHARTSPVLNLAGEPVEGPHSVLLSQFSSNPPPQFDVTRDGSLLGYWLSSDAIGLMSAIDLVVAEQRPSCMARYCGSDKHMAGVYTIPDAPTKRLTLDVFVHSDIDDFGSPEVLAYDTVPRGLPSHICDGNRGRDRLHIAEPVRFLGRAPLNVRLPHVPRYPEMLEYVSNMLRWDLADFRGHRLDVPYPVYGAQYILAFKLPDPPSP